MRLRVAKRHLHHIGRLKRFRKGLYFRAWDKVAAWQSRCGLSAGNARSRSKVADPADRDARGGGDDRPCSWCSVGHGCFIAIRAGRIVLLCASCKGEQGGARVGETIAESKTVSITKGRTVE